MAENRKRRQPDLPNAAVNFLPVSNLYDENEEFIIPNLINGTVVLSGSHIDAVEFFLRLQLLHSMRARVFFEAEDVQVHLLADTRIQLADRLFRSGSDFNAISQNLIPKFSHEIT